MTSMTWNEIFSDLGDPIRGNTSDYWSAYYKSDQLRDAVDGVADEFKRVKDSSELSGMEGKTANELEVLLTGLDESVTELAPLFGTLADAFKHHYDELWDLKRAADTALAKAETRWNAVNEAESEQSSASSALSLIDSNISTLRFSTAEADQTELATLSSDRGPASSRLTSASASLGSARDELRKSRERHGELVETERELVRRTAEKIDDIDLGDLEDPGWLEKLASTVWDYTGGALIDYATSMYKALEAALDGRWMDALSHYRDALGAVAKILTTLAVVALVVGTGGTALAVAGLAVAGATLAADAVLASTQHPHPETGKVTTWGDVAVSAAGVVLAAVGARGALSAAAPTTQAAQRGVYGNARNIVSPTSGVASGGRPLYGAARTSSVNASRRQIVSDVGEFGRDRVADQAAKYGGTKIDGLIDNERLSTNPDDWTGNADLVDYVSRSPATTEGLQRLNHGRGSAYRITQQGATTDPADGGYTLGRVPQAA